MSWISLIEYKDAEGRLKKIYDRVKGHDNSIDNVLKIHSLRPHSLVGHMALYKSVLHNSNNTLPKWYLEAIGVYVSYLNGCNYCVKHHFTGLKRLLEDDIKADNFLEAIKTETLDSYFNNKLYKGIDYAKKLTVALHKVTEDDIVLLKKLGFTEGEILEINQVTSYFNYVNRTVVGLGVTVENETLGLSPNDSDDTENWSHT